MEISIFSKRRTSKEGKTFYQFLSTLEKADGTTDTVRVCFRNVDAPKPESCPRNIVVRKEDCNMATRRFTDPSTGEQKTGRTLWVTAWEPGSEYIDHSLDEYNFN